MDGEITIGTRLDTKNFDKQIEDLERKLERMEHDYSDAVLSGFSEDDEEVRELAIDIEKTRNKIVSLNQQKEKLGKTAPIDNLGKSFQKSLKNVARLTLGIFGIRSAYLALRRASNDLAQYDEQYATNLEYIRFVLTQAIAPVLRTIVSWAMKLLQIINMVINALFGVNLFANGSAEAFKKMKSNAGGVSKAVKEIKKQLTGFDEINVLTDQSDTGTSAGAGGDGMPPLDLGNIKEPEWIGKLKEHLPEIIGLISGVTGALIMMKVLGLDPITSLGIGMAIGGIVYAIENLIEYLDDPSWENFGQIIQGIGIAIIGLGGLIFGLPGIIAGVVVLILGTVVKYWDKIKECLQKGIDWMKSQTDFIKKTFGDGVGAIWEIVTSALQNVLNAFDGLFKGLKQMLDGIIQFIKGVFTGNWSEAWEGLKNIFMGVFNGIKDFVVNILAGIGKIIVASAVTIGLGIKVALKMVMNGALALLESLINLPIKGINKLLDVINKVPRCKSFKNIRG